MKKGVILIILYYVRFFARISLALHKPVVIGITGSLGKSSARNIIYSMIHSIYSSKVIEKGNSETGIPLGILGIEVQSLGLSSGVKGLIDWFLILIKIPFHIFYLWNTKYLIIEMGIDEPYPPKNMEYLLTIVKPDISVVLNAYPVHTMQFEKVLKPGYEKLPAEEYIRQVVEKIAEEKSKIVTKNNKCRLVIFNNDNQYVKNFLIHTQVPKKTFGQGKNNDIWLEKYEVNLHGTYFCFSLDDFRSIDFHFNEIILPEVYREALAAAVLIGKYLNIPIQTIKENIEKNFSLPKGRSTMLQGINDSLIIDSSYNASGQATLSLLSTTVLLKKKYKKPLVFLFGDMRELGTAAQKEHEKVALKIAQEVDELTCVGLLTKKYVIPYIESLKSEKQLKHIMWFSNAKEAGTYLQEHLPHQSVLLVKGSQNTIFLEEAIKFVLKNKTDESKLCRQDEHWLAIKSI